MAEDKQRQLRNYKKKIEMADKLRLLFLILALVVALVLFFGENQGEGMEQLLIYDVVFMLMTTMGKAFLVFKYKKAARTEE